MARGTFMGNRGCLHDEQGYIRRLYQSKRWIICQLDFKGRRRSLMRPGHYTELFFLDEATALAAGHRPCAECMRARFNTFRTLWAQANRELAGEMMPPAPVIDAVLHGERLTPTGQKMTYPEQLARLPTGSFVMLESSTQPYLVFEQTLLAWQPEGYGPRLIQSGDRIVQVLTPRSVVQTLALGYQPVLHPTAVSR